MLSAREDDEGGEQRAYGTAGASSELEEGLCEAVLASRGHAGDARGLGVEYRRAYSDERGGEQQQAKARREGEQQQAGKGDGHPDGERVWRGAAVDVVSDEGLQQ